jgi:hypothetical protein
MEDNAIPEFVFAANNFNKYNNRKIFPVGEEKEIHKSAFGYVKPRDFTGPDDELPYVSCLYGDFFLDLDCKDDPGKAQQDAIWCLKTLRDKFNVPAGAILIQFTGYKGFRITVNAETLGVAEHKSLHLIFKWIAKELNTYSPNKTIEWEGSAYNPRKTLRLPNTINNKSGYYCVYITHDELNLNMSEIKTLAQTPRELLTYTSNTLDSAANKIYALAVLRYHTLEKQISIREFKELDHTLPCIEKILNTNCPEGLRDYTAITLAIYFYNAGMTEEESLSRLTKWSREHCYAGNFRAIDPLPHRVLLGKVKSAFRHKYKFNCNNDLVCGNCIPECKFLTKESDNDKLNVLSLTESLEAHEKRAWRDKELIGYKTGFDKFTQAIDGLQPGLYVVAGKSNIGKSAFTIDLTLGVLNNNPEVSVLYCSYDDPAHKTLSRLISSYSACYSIKQIQNPRYALATKKDRDNRNYIVQSFKEQFDNRLWIRGIECDSFIEETEATIIEMRQNNPNLIVIIDHFHKLLTRESAHHSDKAKYDYISNVLKKIATNQDVPVVVVAELRKLNEDRRPFLDDVKETNSLEYDSDCVLLFHSDVHANGQGADIYFMRKDVEEPDTKQPILECHVAKNKLGGFKSRILFRFFTDRSSIEEMPWSEAYDIVNRIERECR